jgi:hypothetical protein
VALPGIQFIWNDASPLSIMPAMYSCRRPGEVICVACTRSLVASPGVISITSPTVTNTPPV